MKFLIFNSEEDWNQAKNVVNTAYNCPYANSDYFMITWDNGNKHLTENKWQIQKPEDRLNATSAAVMAALEASNIFFVETTELPQGWYPLVEGDI